MLGVDKAFGNSLFYFGHFFVNLKLLQYKEFKNQENLNKKVELIYVIKFTCMVAENWIEEKNITTHRRIIQRYISIVFTVQWIFFKAFKGKKLIRSKEKFAVPSEFIQMDEPVLSIG